jgi:WD40 repeat protein
MLVSGSEDKTIRVWDMRSGLCLKVLQGHSGIVRYVMGQAIPVINVHAAYARRS